MTKLIKILHVSSALSWRGGEQQIVNLLDGLNLIDDRVDQMVYCARNSALEKYLISNQFPCKSGKKKSAISLFFVNGLISLIKNYQPNIIHIHDSHAHTASVLAHLITLSKTPIILHRRVDFSIGKSVFSTFKYNYPAIKRIITVSEAIKNIIKPKVKAKISVVYSSWRKSIIDNSKEVNLRKELGVSNSTILIGNIAALTDHKDYPTFLKTAVNITNKYENVHFIVAGEGELRREIEQQIDTLNLKNKIHLLGFRKDVVEIMKNLDVFFMPSKMEGLGSVLYTAFACKIPVVSTNAGGIPELVKNQKTGFTAEVGQYLDLSKCLEKAMDKNIDKNDMIEKAFQLALENQFTQMAEKNYNIYLDLLKI
jgi:glycosyltransferase involved in cell wall biosynthesis